MAALHPDDTPSDLHQPTSARTGGVKRQAQGGVVAVDLVAGDPAGGYPGVDRADDHVAGQGGFGRTPPRRAPRPQRSARGRWSRTWTGGARGRSWRGRWTRRRSDTPRPGRSRFARRCRCTGVAPPPWRRLSSGPRSHRLPAPRRGRRGGRPRTHADHHRPRRCPSSLGPAGAGAGRDGHGRRARPRSSSSCAADLIPNLVSSGGTPTAATPPRPATPRGRHRRGIPARREWVWCRTHNYGVSGPRPRCRTSSAHRSRSRATRSRGPVAP